VTDPKANHRETESVESIAQSIQTAGWGERLASNVLFWLWLSMASLVPLLELASHEDEVAGMAREPPPGASGLGAITAELP
jgi:hypothetical protein